MLVIIAAASSLWWLRPGHATEITAYTVREPAASADATVLNASGYVTARRSATVSSKITGRLVEVLVEEGVAVREGQVLARLDDARYRASLDLSESQRSAAKRAVEETEARIDLARLTLDRTRRLLAEGVVGQAELDAVETEVETLEARLSVARQEVVVAQREVALRRTELEDTVIGAPFDGIVISKDAQPGETVSPVSAGGGFTRTGICTIVDMQALEIEIDVNESYISRVYQGQRVEAILDAYPGWRIPAKVITTIPAADRQKATVRVRIGFDELDPRILPDMGIKVAFREQTTAEGPTPRRGVSVPRSALRRDGDRDVVYLVRDGRVERRAVSVEATTDQQAKVIAGLSPGEQVVIDGPDDLAQGDRVTVR